MRISKFFSFCVLVLLFSCNTSMEEVVLEVENKTSEPIEKVEFFREGEVDTLNLENLAAGEIRTERYKSKQDASAFVYQIIVTKEDGSQLKSKQGFLRNGLMASKPELNIFLHDEKIKTEWD